MEKKKLKQLIRGKGNHHRVKRKRVKESVNNPLLPGDIVIYNSIIDDAVYADPNDGKIYLCLGDADSSELGNLGNLISGSFSDLRIIAVLESAGDVNFFVADELIPAGD
jgi:hypothetical protein